MTARKPLLPSARGTLSHPDYLSYVWYRLWDRAELHRKRMDFELQGTHLSVLGAVPDQIYIALGLPLQRWWELAR